MDVFNEEQKFDSLFILIPLAIVSVVSVFLIRTASLHNSEIVAVFIPGLIIALIFYIIKLETRMDASGIHFQFKPFQFNRKSISWDEISNAYVRQYKPLWEYGGYGIRRSFRNGQAYNISGKTGIQIELKNGKKILLGTKKGSDASTVLQRYLKKK